MVRLKAVLLKVDYSHGVIATYCSAIFGKITSAELVNWVTICVGLLTAVKIILDIRKNLKGNATKRAK
jgi:hypothetical protein